MSSVFPCIISCRFRSRCSRSPHTSTFKSFREYEIGEQFFQPGRFSMHASSVCSVCQFESCMVSGQYDDIAATTLPYKNSESFLWLLLQSKSSMPCSCRNLYIMQMGIDAKVEILLNGKSQDEQIKLLFRKSTCQICALKA